MKTIYRVKLEIMDVELEVFEFAFTEPPTVESVINYLERKQAELLGTAKDCSVGCAADLPEINVMALLIERIKSKVDVKAHVMAIDLVEG